MSEPDSTPPSATVPPAAAPGGGPSSSSSACPYHLPPMPLLPISSPRTIQRCKQLQTDARDIFIASYPKSGTTWTQAIVRALLALRRRPSSASSDAAGQSGAPPPDADDDDDWHITEYCPFFEVDRTWRAPPSAGDADAEDGEPFAPLYTRRQRETGRRAFNTHLRWEMMPTDTGTGGGGGGRDGEGARFLYLIRDGRDVAVSYYHHMRSMAVADGGFEGTWADFFEAWCRGEVAFGAWIDHLLSWCGGPAATDPRVLFLRYEDLKADLPGALRRIAAHLRLDPLPTEAEIARVAEVCSLDGMRAARGCYEPRSVAWRDPAFRFIRKGEVGDHAALFTPAQRARFARGLFERYGAAAAAPSGSGAGVGVGPGVLPAFVTEALVGGEAGLLKEAALALALDDSERREEGEQDDEGEGAAREAAPSR